MAAANAPPIGAGVRFQATELGPGWHRGFFNQTRTVPPCYILILFESRSSPEQPRRIKQTLSVASVQRLQVTTAPGLSMEERDGLALSPVPDKSWCEIELAPLRAGQGQCPLEALGS